MASKLAKYRETINQIDQQLTELFEQRLAIVKEIALVKQAEQLPIFDATREAAVLAKNLIYLKDQTLKTYHQNFFSELMQISKAYQLQLLNQKKVAYQGDQGAFAHLAAKQLFPYYGLVNYPTFASVFEALKNQSVNWAVLPLENSYYGEVGEVLDLLLCSNCQINASYDLPIKHQLVGLPTADLAKLSKVYSHPQAISQCSKFLKGLNIEIINYSNTALAAQYIFELNDPTCAAIAAKETAELYHLNILVPDIQDYIDNHTRFIVISNETTKTGDLASVIFTSQHESGALNKLLNIISQYGFNLQAIKSRPYQSGAWSYYFYIELTLNQPKEKLAQLLQELASTGSFVKLLGIYSPQANWQSFQQAL